jgi:hypothetical protein
MWRGPPNKKKKKFPYAPNATGDHATLSLGGGVVVVLVVVVVIIK